MIYKHELVQDDFELQLRFEVIHTSSEYFPAHWHNHLEILFILDGTMTAYVNDRKYELLYHDMLIINPREIHSTQIHGSIRYILLQIPLDDLKRLMPNFEMLHFEEYYPHVSSKSGASSKVESLLLQMENEFEKKDNGYQLLFTSMFYELLHELYKNHSKQLSFQSKNKAAKNLHRIELIMEYVKSHYQKPITLDEISGILSVSPEYFCRLFKKNTSQTFLEYTNTARLVHFHSDLLRTNESITYLMDKNGITNYKVFIRMFRNAYGNTPNKIRKNA